MARIPPPALRPALLLMAPVLALACTSVLGIDGEYVEQASGGGQAGKGGSETGATAGTGGNSDTGGSGGTNTGGTGGRGGSGGTLTGGTGGTLSFDAGPCATTCGANEKCCVGVCQPTGPGNGCRMDTCAPCPLPDNAVGKCNGDVCEFDCANNTVREGNVCVPSTTGTGGAGGGPPTQCTKTNLSACPQCITAIYAPCCQSNGQCGCAFPFAPCFPN